MRAVGEQRDARGAGVSNRRQGRWRVAGMYGDREREGGGQGVCGLSGVERRVYLGGGCGEGHFAGENNLICIF